MATMIVDTILHTTVMILDTRITVLPDTTIEEAQLTRRLSILIMIMSPRDTEILNSGEAAISTDLSEMSIEDLLLIT